MASGRRCRRNLLEIALQTVKCYYLVSVLPLDNHNFIANSAASFVLVKVSLYSEILGQILSQSIRYMQLLAANTSKRGAAHNLQIKVRSSGGYLRVNDLMRSNQISLFATASHPLHLSELPLFHFFFLFTYIFFLISF